MSFIPASAPTQDPSAFHDRDVLASPHVAPEFQAPVPGDHPRSKALGRRIIICTDTWRPQMNGAVRQLSVVIEILQRRGYEIELVHPFMFPRIPVPMNHDIEVPCRISHARLSQLFSRGGPRAIFVATEATLGLAARRICIRRGLPFTTWYATDWPITMRKLILAPIFLSNRLMNWYHKYSTSVLCPTPTMRRKLQEEIGLRNRVATWPGAVDANLFRPRPKTPRARKIAMYVGRVAKEKGLEEFLRCRGDYDKVVVGDGHARRGLERQFPDARFLGCRFGEELAEAYSMADVFVFPSRTDSFGLVILEALACGVPVAAFPVQGPIDIIDRPGVGCLSENLEEAIETALATSDPLRCRELALDYSWERQAERLVENLTFFD